MRNELEELGKRVLHYEDEHGRTNTAFTLDSVEHLIEMVLEGRWPDGRYGDAECIAWSIIRSTFREHGIAV